MYCKIFTKSVQENLQVKAIRQWLSSKLANWRMAVTHKAGSSLSDGGLWSITEPAQKVFCRIEHYFRQTTLRVASNLQRVDIAGIVQKSVSDIYI